MNGNKEVDRYLFFYLSSERHNQIVTSWVMGQGSENKCVMHKFSSSEESGQFSAFS